MRAVCVGEKEVRADVVVVRLDVTSLSWAPFFFLLMIFGQLTMQKPRGLGWVFRLWSSFSSCQSRFICAARYGLGAEDPPIATKWCLLSDFACVTYNPNSILTK
jgi:hypothetical protein